MNEQELLHIHREEPDLVSLIAFNSHLSHLKGAPPLLDVQIKEGSYIQIFIAIVCSCSIVLTPTWCA